MKSLYWPLQASFLGFAILTMLLVLTVLEASEGQDVVRWNNAMVDSIRSEQTSTADAAHQLALMHLAMYNAAAEPSASARAALNAAAERVASSIYPKYAQNFQAVMKENLSGIPDQEAGIVVGLKIADQLLEQRSNDRRLNTIVFNVDMGKGIWKPGLALSKDIMQMQWESYKPFALKKASQFRPGPPRDLDDKRYLMDWAEVRLVGAYDSQARSDDQTQIAYFWEDGVRTSGPVGHWNTIAAQVVGEGHNDLLQNARFFAVLNIALADSSIAAADAKYRYLQWRPEAAIQESKMDVQWQSLLETPADPEYVSIQSALAAAAAEVLTSQFGNQLSFTASSEAVPVTRRYANFAAAAKEAGEGSLYGGVHFRASGEAGAKLGRRVGRYVITNLR